MGREHSKEVMTWQSPSGNSLRICMDCGVALSRYGEWPRDVNGQVYCRVIHGRHRGRCDFGRGGLLHVKHGEPWTGRRKQTGMDGV